MSVNDRREPYSTDREMNSERLSKLEKFDVSARSGKFVTNRRHEFRWHELLNTNFNELIQMQQARIKNESDDSLLSKQKALLEVYQKAHPRG